MTALETLVTPSKEVNGITEIIKRRIVALINNESVCSNNRINKIYKLRSDIVHGRRRVDLDFDKEINKLKQLQLIALEAFKRIINIDFKNV